MMSDDVGVVPEAPLPDPISQHIAVQSNPGSNIVGQSFQCCYSLRILTSACNWPWCDVSDLLVRAIDKPVSTQLLLNIDI